MIILSIERLFIILILILKHCFKLIIDLINAIFTVSTDTCFCSIYGFGIFVIKNINFSFVTGKKAFKRSNTDWQGFT